MRVESLGLVHLREKTFVATRYSSLSLTWLFGMISLLRHFWRMRRIMRRVRDEWLLVWEGLLKKWLRWANLNEFFLLFRTHAFRSLSYRESCQQQGCSCSNRVFSQSSWQSIKYLPMALGTLTFFLNLLSSLDYKLLLFLLFSQDTLSTLSPLKPALWSCKEGSSRWQTWRVGSGCWLGQKYYSSQKCNCDVQFQRESSLSFLSMRTKMSSCWFPCRSQKSSYSICPNSPPSSSSFPSKFLSERISSQEIPSSLTLRVLIHSEEAVEFQSASAFFIFRIGNKVISKQQQAKLRKSLFLIVG